jgi:hypothetical protein
MWLVVAVYATVCALVLGLTGVLTTLMGIAGAGVAWLTGTTLVAGVLLLRRDLWVPRTKADEVSADNTASDYTVRTAR